MKINIYSILLIITFMLVSYQVGFAAGSPFEGDVTVRGQIVDVKGDEAKFDEYGDTRSGVYGGINLNYDNRNYFMRFNAEDILYKTQRYNFEGGMWGKFSYKLFYNELPHNITFGARSFYSGIGGASLVQKSGVALDDVKTWTSFDYKTERKKFGAGLSLDLIKPFFFTVSADTEKKEGIKPTSFGTIHTGEALTELPEPINYRTDTFRVEAGYGKKPFFASLSYLGSKFSNDDHNLFFEDIFSTYTEHVSLPPDNKYYKLSFKSALFLPYNSRLSVNAGSARARSHYDGNTVTSIVDDPFNARVDTTNYDVVLTSNPVSYLDGKIFYKYYDRDKVSEGDEDHLGYTNNSFGGQFVFKLPQQLRLTLGYTNKNTNYNNRFDARERKDDIYSADLVWSKLQFATIRIGYELLQRSSDRYGTEAVAEPDFIWRFDVAPVDRTTFKASADLFLVDNLSLTVGYKYKNTEYEDSPLAGAPRGLGLQDYKSDGFFVDAGYAFGKVARLYGYFDYEKVRSSQRGHSSIEDTDWSLIQRESNYDYGIGADFFIIPKKLTVKANYDYVRSDGSADFTYLDMATPPGSDIGKWGDYRKSAFSLKATYEFTKAVSLSAGYVYERYRLDDNQLNGYSYNPDATAYMTGAYKDQSYKANILFMNVVYKF